MKLVRKAESCIISGLFLRIVPQLLKQSLLVDCKARRLFIPRWLVILYRIFADTDLILGTHTRAGCCGDVRLLRLQL